MRFKVDENLPSEIAETLLVAGYDAMTVFDQNMSGASDLSLIDICKKENRILVTLDLDFADISTYPPNECPGIVVLRVRHQDKLHLAEVFRKAVKRFEQELLECRLWIVEETQIRIHDHSEA
jgi:predicted nuclease of predicted toxin-antitoxin system